MSRRLTLTGIDKEVKPGGLKGLFIRSKSLGKRGIQAAQWCAGRTGRIGWIVLTTACVTILPLYFEITREQQMIEQEKMQVGALLAEGRTRQEIASMGLFSALDPTVLPADGAK